MKLTLSAGGGVTGLSKEHTIEVNALDEATRAALRKIMSEAQEGGLLSGHPAELAEQFTALLWRDWMMGLLLGVAERPSAREITDRAREAAMAFLRLHLNEPRD